MREKYLINGQKCYVKEKIGNKYIVNKVYRDDDGEYSQEIIDETDSIVDAVFDNPPKEYIEEEIKLLLSKKNSEIRAIKNIQEQKTKIANELERITQTQISSEKFIINRSELIAAKKIALFPKSSIAPIIKEGEMSGIKIQLEIRVSDGDERCWGYKIYRDYQPCGDFLCEKYGILINPTESEIIRVARQRASEFEFSGWVISNTDDIFLTDTLLDKKHMILENSGKVELKNLEEKLEETKKKIETLKCNLNHN
jgi:hypothetical protein